MEKLVKSRIVRAICALVLAIGLTPVQYLALGFARSVPAYASTAVPKGAVQDTVDYMADKLGVSADSFNETALSIRVDQSYVDADGSKASTIEDFFDRYGVDHLLTTMASTVYLFHVDGDADNVYGFVGNNVLNKSGKFIDWSLNDDDLKDPLKLDKYADYDSKTGIIRVSKNAFCDDGTNADRVSLVMQLLMSANSGVDSTSSYTVHIDNDNDLVTVPSRTSVVRSDTFDVTTSMRIATPDTASNLDIDDIEVRVNGSETPLDLRTQDDNENDIPANASYDESDGTLSLAVSAASLSRVDVHIKAKNSIERLFSVPKANAGTTSSADLGFFKYAHDVDFKKCIPEDLKEGSLYSFSDTVWSFYGGNLPVWAKGVRKKTRPYVYVDSTGSDRISHNIRYRSKYDWGDLTGDTGSVSRLDLIDKTYYGTATDSFYFELPTSSGNLVEERSSKKAPGTLKFSGWDPCYTNSDGKSYAWTVGVCTHPSGGATSDNMHGSEMVRILKINWKASRPYMVIALCSKTKLGGDQEGYTIIKIHVSKSTGKCRVTKSSYLNWDLTQDGGGKYIKNNKQYGSLEDAEFGIYKTETNAKDHKSAIDTFKSGKTSKDLEPGTYYVSEITSPKGYLIDTDVHKVTVKAGETASVKIKDIPRYGHPKGKIVKVVKDKDGNEYVRDATGRLGGAEFTLTGPSNLGCKLTTDSNGYIKFKGAYAKKLNGRTMVPVNDDNDNIWLPLGTWTLTETKAPDGFALPDASLSFITLKVSSDNTNERPGTSITATVGKQGNAGETIGNLAKDGSSEVLFHETEGTGQGFSTLAQVPSDMKSSQKNSVSDQFSYSGLKGGGSYKWTDEIHVRSSSGQDLGVLKHNGSSFQKQGSFTASSSGSGTFTTPSFDFPADDGNYTAGPSNAPIKLKDVSFVFWATVDGPGLKSPLAEKSIDNTMQTFTFTDSPVPPPPGGGGGGGGSISTQASPSSNDMLDPYAESNSLSDTISFDGLVSGQQYTWTSELHVRDVDGNDLGILVGSSGEFTQSGQFTASSSSGTVHTTGFTLAGDNGQYRTTDSGSIKLEDVSLVFFARITGAGVDFSEQNLDADSQTINFYTVVIPPPEPNPEPSHGSFTIHKQVTGISVAECNRRGYKFGFRLTDSSGAQIGPVQYASADGSVSFDTPTYTQDDSGSHLLYVQEVAGTDGHWSYDTASRPVNVSVSSDSTQVYVSCNVGGRGDTFTNVYTPSGGLKLKKVDDSWAPISGISFEVTGPTSTTITTDSGGIAATSDHALKPGDYTVRERIPSGAVTVTKDNCGDHPERVGLVKYQGRYMDPNWSTTVTVVDGQVADLTGSPVVNPLESARAVFKAHKRLVSTIDGTELPIHDGQFAFEVYSDAKKTKPVFSDSDGKATKFYVDSNGDVTFPSVEFDGSKIGATESYYVFESDLGDPDTTYAEGAKRVTVTTGFDDASGETFASVSYYDGDGSGTASSTPYAFVDRYTPKGQLTIGKTDADTGETLAGAEFTVKAKGSDVVADTITTDAGGTATTKRLALGTYVITETKAPAGYDVNERVMEATIESDGQVVDLTDNPFTDTVASAKVSVSAFKTLDGRQVRDGEFSFILLDADGNVAGDAKCDSSGNVSFPELSFSADFPGDTKVYHYKIKEHDSQEPGIVYDPTIADVVITVSKVQGGAQADVSYSKPVRYRICCDLAGGKVLDPVEWYWSGGGDPVALPEPSRDGYVFSGWTGSNGTTPQDDVVLSPNDRGDKYYTANWAKVVSYGISYDLAGGTNSNDNPNSYDSYSGDISLDAPTKAGYTFAGWTGTGLSAPTKEVTIPRGSTGDRSYKATWSPIEYQVGYDLDGGQNAASNPTKRTVDSGDIMLSQPTKEGYTFAGWTGSNGSTPQKDVTIKADTLEDTSFKAHWELQ